MRPKSYSFMDSKDVILQKNITEHVDDSKINEINPLEKMSSLTNLSSHTKARSFLRDFRKLFMKNKTSTDATANTITTTTTTTNATTTSTKINYSLDSIEMENEREDLNDSVTSLRKKSSSWSHCERQKFFRKYHKLAESKLTSTRAQRNDRRMGFISQTVTKNTERGSTVYSKESPAGMPSKQWQSDQRDAINSFYKSLKSKTMKIGIKKKQTDETNDSIWILRIHKNDDSGL
ncbi:unnamed protein product [Acanthocheilonema viteae]|uniref:Uncharacterized protein n=1 Tax=Acanthocheilonema viteae TaxID=6277 RepID=A0A498SJC4_ACAVI|nr:unnamed protein product [Acanthocheilonema viteae]